MELEVLYPREQNAIITYRISDGKFDEESAESFQGSPKNVYLTFYQCGGLLRLLDQNLPYRLLFVRHQRTSKLVVNVVGNDVFPIDYKSCSLVSSKLWEAIEREDALHWLSTLGGAFSNLGEHSVHFAKKAGENALRQLRIIAQIGDPALSARCWIFIAMSLMQQKRLRASKRILQRIYFSHKSLPDGHADPRILKMCQGCWARLKFHWQKQFKNGHMLDPDKRS